ncbi:MAG: hypothetical protein H6724_07590 [Sandaracinus sp.]|nr:hypothetical protein [Sandaracinus sp.]
MFRRSPFFSTFLWLTAALGGCDCGEAGVEVDGPNPYVRCGAREPREGSWSSGSLRFSADERVLRVEGLERFVVISAVGTEGELPELPVLVLGGATVPGLLEALGERPVLLLPGGDDDAEAYADRLDELPSDAKDRVVDLAGFHELVTPHGRFVLVPGADEGRYGVGEGACGFGEADLEARGDFEGEVSWLLSWAAPRVAGEHGVDRGLGGAHAGSPSLGAFAETLGVRGGIFAFPRESAALPAHFDGSAPLAEDQPATDLAVVVPSFGAPTERFDEGSLTRDHLVIELGPDGLRVVSPGT